MKEINAIRGLSVDMIEKANSGHPGICLGAAPMMYSLYGKQMKVYAKESNWINRDRFILSAGHGSAMLYSTLHLSGYDLSLLDLKGFRQLNSKTPGHPEVGHTDGIDSTSGPLGQGFAQGVGFALSEKHLSAKYNQQDMNLIDHYTYVLCGDGDLQEGITSEASSIAGHLKLNKLIVLWDSNDIQLDSAVSKSSTEDINTRYLAYNWNVIVVVDGTDEDKINQAIEKAKISDKPTLIEVKTKIGYGAPSKEGTSDAHGAPLGKEEMVLLKENLNMPMGDFEIEKDSNLKFLNNTITQGKIEFKKHEKLVKEYSEEYPKLYKEYITDSYEFNLIEYELGFSEASRVSSGKTINEIAKSIPNFIGGSADLSKSNNTIIGDNKIFGIDSYDSQNIYYGVREFAMAAINNGINLHGGLKAFCATFFVFSDYLKPALRMSALQNIPSIYVLTHDSIAVGEDGPTHEPVEQLSGLRGIPNVNIIRPCDANETQYAWRSAMESKTTPTVLILSRQNLKVVTDMKKLKDSFEYGGYVLSSDEKYTKVLIASGSEVNLALEVKKELNKKDINVRVVSMSSMNRFKEQAKEYQNKILGNVGRENTYYIEMATAYEAYEFAGNLINVETFGKSGNGDLITIDYGFDALKITKEILNEKY